MAGEGEYDVGTVDRHTAITRSLLRLVPDSLLGRWLGDPDEQRRTFVSGLATLEADVAVPIEEQATVLDREHFLTATERRGMHENVRNLEEGYEALRTMIRPFVYSDDDLDRLSTLRTDLQGIVQRFEAYNTEFVDLEVSEYESQREIHVTG